MTETVTVTVTVTVTGSETRSASGGRPGARGQGRLRLAAETAGRGRLSHAGRVPQACRAAFGGHASALPRYSCLFPILIPPCFPIILAHGK